MITGKGDLQKGSDGSERMRETVGFYAYVGVSNSQLFVYTNSVTDQILRRSS